MHVKEFAALESKAGGCFSGRLTMHYACDEFFKHGHTLLITNSDWSSKPSWCRTNSWQLRASFWFQGEAQESRLLVTPVMISVPKYSGPFPNTSSKLYAVTTCTASPGFIVHTYNAGCICMLLGNQGERLESIAEASTRWSGGRQWQTATNQLQLTYKTLGNE